MNQYKYKPIMFGASTYFSLANKLMDLGEETEKLGAFKALTTIYHPTEPEKWIEKDVWGNYDWDENLTNAQFADKCKAVASALYSDGCIF